MPTVQPGLNVKSLAEVAWLASQVGRRMIAAQSPPTAPTLREFWQSTRALQQHWDELLDSLAPSDIATPQFKEVATQLFTTEMLVRVWATILGRIDQNTGGNDLTRIVANAVSGLLRIRNRLVTLLLSPSVPAAWGADLDRLRRRCDRWTDLLIGTICGRDEFFQFAFNPDRARDFAEESREAGSSTSHPVELLVAAGVRLSFLGQLPEVAFNSPAFEQLIRAILGSLPTAAFEQDGSLRFQCLQNNAAVQDELSNTDSGHEDVLLPGISLADLRYRFS